MRLARRSLSSKYEAACWSASRSRSVASGGGPSMAAQAGASSMYAARTRRRRSWTYRSAASAVPSSWIASGRCPCANATAMRRQSLLLSAWACVGHWGMSRPQGTVSLVTRPAGGACGRFGCNDCRSTSTATRTCLVMREQAAQYCTSCLRRKSVGCLTCWRRNPTSRSVNLAPAATTDARVKPGRRSATVRAQSVALCQVRSSP